ncbi:hypothetical protein ABPG77_001474 [Micractinium sp. CCAP 211/92]
MESSVPKWLPLALSVRGEEDYGRQPRLNERRVGSLKGSCPGELDAKVEAYQAEARNLVQPLVSETARLKGEQRQHSVMAQQMGSALISAMQGGTSTPRLQGGTGESSNPSPPQ